MKVVELQNKKILIVGYGKEGKSVEAYLKLKLPQVQIGIADKEQGADYLTVQSQYDIAIKSPGVPKELLQIPYTTATNLFFGNVGKNTIVGVTGSKGKSTTASVIYEILKLAGRKVQLLGNIGKPVLDALMKPYAEDEVFIVELSSYQLADSTYSPHIAVIVSLFPEHLDYHGSLESYYAAKQKILQFQQPDDYYVYNPLFPKLKDWAETSVSKAMPFIDTVPMLDDEIPLLGQHNKRNVQGAATVAKLFNVTDQDIKNAVMNFKPLPHRLEFVGEYRGVKFYDDAISTTPESTIEAIKALQYVTTIFLGGQNRGYDFSQLAKTMKDYYIENIVLFPDSGQAIEEALKKEGLSDLHILRTSSMKEAVEFAYKNTQEGKICLLSSASPSYSLWKNFEEKGTQFKEFVTQSQ